MKIFDTPRQAVQQAVQRGCGFSEEGYRQASLLGERLFHENIQVVYIQQSAAGRRLRQSLLECRAYHTAELRRYPLAIWKAWKTGTSR